MSGPEGRSPGRAEAAVPRPFLRWGPALVNRHSGGHRGYEATSLEVAGGGSGPGGQAAARKVGGGGVLTFFFFF